MPKKSNHPQILLPARMTIRPEAFQNLAVAVLDMPYGTAIQNFLNKAKESLDHPLTPPYTLLNSAIVACAPTVTHGFEGRGQNRRMMAVGKPLYDSVGRIVGSDFQYPSEETIAQLISAWIYQWGRSRRFKHLIEGQLESIWNELTKAISEPPETKWRKIPADSLVRDLSAEKGLAFNAIPSLLATLLHEQESFIGDLQMPVKWRRSQDDKEKFCAVSYPIPTFFLKEPDFREESKKAKEIQDFFAYKLVFRVQTQTGREEPWIYAFLHCQRYARLPLTSNKRGNDITILSALNVERLDGCDRDSTLVRLKAGPAPKGKYVGWRDDLPELLEQINARPLATPAEIFSKPKSFWQSQSTQELQDEYYVIHTEGYKYSKSNHAVKTGFGLAERSNVIDQICCNLLSDFLEPSEVLEPDSLNLPNKQCPLALKSFVDLAKRPDLIDKKKAEKLGLSEEERQYQRAKKHKNQRQERQPIVYEALKRATDSLPLRIVILYRNEDTCIAVRQQIRDGLLLNEEDSFPPNIVAEEHLTTDELLQPLNSADLDPATFLKKWSEWPENFRGDWNKQMKKSHREKMKNWRSYLQSIISEKNQNHAGQQTLAIIELKNHKAGASFHDSQGIKGAVREACVREKILSQMILPIKLKRTEESSEVSLRREDKGRVQNTVLDITTRQTGVIYGSVTEVYETIGLSEDVAQKLDVIAFVLKQIRSKPQAYYGLAVRLRANGKIDVLLPSLDGWIPYCNAGWKVGQLFAEARKHRPSVNIYLSVSELVDFAEDTLTNKLSAPSIALVRAEVWRNWRKDGGWTQLRVTDLAERMNVLEFANAQNHPIPYKRKDPRLDNLLAVIRLRDREEAPQYVTNRQAWQSDRLTRDLRHLSGFTEFTEQNIFHYFSVGRLPSTVKSGQERQGREDPYKSEDGGGIAFKHQQMIEMLPFFVHPNFQSKAGLETLCSIPHYLRSSPAWGVGNLLLPYPMHLGLKLIEDQICIL